MNFLALIIGLFMTIISVFFLMMNPTLMGSFWFILLLIMFFNGIFLTTMQILHNIFIDYKKKISIICGVGMGLSAIILLLLYFI